MSDAKGGSMALDAWYRKYAEKEMKDVKFCLGFIHSPSSFHSRTKKILVLPLTVPVLIFGVAASNAAIVGPVPFGTPFTVLCALTLMSVVIGPLAAAIALRQGLE